MISKEEIENIDIKNIILLDTDKSGDMYMEKLFPLWTNVVVVTLEGKYPKNDYLKKISLDLLENDSSIYCIQFGAKSEKYSIKSEKKLRMSYFLLVDLTYQDRDFPAFDFDDGMLVTLMMAFTGDSIARLSKDRLTSYDPMIENAKPESIKWFHHMLKTSK